MSGESGREPIAIVGCGSRIPGTDDGPEGYWRLLADGRHAIREVPRDRWDVEALYDPDPAAPGKMNSRYGAFLDDVAGFDAEFFGIRPGETKQMDPQQRLLLEVSVDALHDAGIAPSTLAGSKTAVYTGSIAVDYWLMHARSAGLAGIDTAYASGKEFSFGPGRLSYLLGLTGPSMSVSSACSSSLVGVHLGCRSLRAGEADLVLVGGSSLILSPELTIFMSQVGALAPDGRCKVFDARADGTVRGEACIVVVLKRLCDAVASGDDIIAVIKGSAVNHNGHSAGMTVPSGAAQQRVIADALADAGVRPEEIGYLEAHGTGTALGDPVEMGAAAAALGALGRRESPLLVGSSKTNIGHTDAAAGLAGLLKAALSLRRGAVPAHLHFRDPHPGIRWDSWPVAVPTELTPWPRRPGETRRAGVSAFGLSGSNAHVVLEEAPQVPAPILQREGPVILALSARHRGALEEMIRRHRDRLGELRSSGESVVGYAACAARARDHHAEHRAAIMAEGADKLHEKLTRLAETGFAANTSTGAGQLDGATAFVFSGQGLQWPFMATSLLSDVDELAEPVFSTILDDCDRLIAHMAGWSVRAELEAGAAGHHLTDTRYAQPVIFAVQVALAALWRSWGIEPDAVIGHSMGEVAAAHVAGALDLPSAVRTIVLRGELLAVARGQGRMVAVALPRDQAQMWAARVRGVDVAAENAPSSTVLSGEPESIDELCAALAGEGIGVRRMPGQYAFHGRQMSTFQQPLRDGLRGLAVGEPTIPVATTTPCPERVPLFGPDYWAANVREPVDFAAAAAKLIEAGTTTFIELGPHSSLARPLTELLAEREGLVVPSLRRNTEDRGVMLESLGRLYTAGRTVRWDRVLPDGGTRHRLPGYPWQHRHFWFDPPGGPPVAAPPEESADALAEESAEESSRTARLLDRTLDDVVASVVGTLLGVAAERVEHTQGFAEMGLDSLNAVELRRTLQDVLGRRLSSTLAFDYPSVRRLADHLRATEVDVTPRVPVSAPTRRVMDEPKRTDTAGAIAVVGIGCRFPGGAGDPDSFWDLLGDRVDAITEVPAGRFADGGQWDGGRWYGGFLDVVDEFDARFFRMPPKEARGADPQQRMFLEVAWEAVEHAGIPPHELSGTRTGVFVGMNSADHAALAAADPDAVDGFYGTGNSFSGAPGRLSYFLGARGPSLAVDTACSSSLVATHLAIASLRAGECDLAIVGGVNVMLRSTIHRASAALGALAADGRCKPFAAAADGYTRGEGCGVVVLRRLPDARAIGERVLAVLLGSAVNQDGASSGLTVPNGPAQTDLVREAIADAGIRPEDIGYIEAHGTGTPLGDPIELRALGAALGARVQPCYVGSVKSNIGHLEAAAGIAGLIKAVLAVHHAQVPASLHFEEPTPEVPWDELPLRVPTQRIAWPRAGRPVAGVSAFGFTGTNAHVVVAADTAEIPDRPKPEDTEDSTACHLLALSAVTEQALAAQARSVRIFLDEHPEARLADVCYTAGVRRSHLSHRVTLAARGRAELVERLAALERGESAEPAGAVVPGVDGGPVFVFSGHGGQWAGMARALLADEPVFGAAVRRCSEVMRGYLDWSVYDLLATGGWTESTQAHQELVFAIQVGLAELWRSRGVAPAAVVGHSMGEIAAAHVAGVLDLDAAARLLCLRATFITRLVELGGGMAVVGLSPEATERELERYPDRLWVAVVNSSQSTVVSGEREAIDELLAELTERNVFARPVKADGAGHCPTVAPVAEDFVSALDWLRPAEPELPFYSSVTGTPETVLDAGYWGRNMRERVRFADAVGRLAGDGHRVFVELSAHPLLLTSIDHELDRHGLTGISVGSMVRDGDDTVELLRALGRLHVHGHPVDWRSLSPDDARLSSAPRYAWDHRSHRLDVAPSSPPRSAGAPISSVFAGEDGGDVVSVVCAARAEIARWGQEWASVPVWLAGVTRFASEHLHGSRLQLSGVDLPEPAIASVDTEACAVRMALSFPPGSEEATVSVDISGAGCRVRARLLPGGTIPDDVDEASGWERVDVSATGLAERQYEAVSSCVAALCLAAGDQAGPYPGRPRHLDLLQVAAGFDRWSSARWRVRATVNRRADTSVTGDVTLIDEDAAPVLRLRGLRLDRVQARDTPAPALLRTTTWLAAPRHEPPEPASGPETGSWFVLGDPGGLGTGVVERLRAAGRRAVLVDLDEVDTGFAALRREHGCAGVVHLLGAGLARETPSAQPDHRRLAGDEACRVYASIPAVAGQAAARGAGPTPRVWYVTHGARQHGRRGPVTVEQAPVWGIARACAMEHPASWGGLLDLDPLARGPAELAEQIVAEVTAPDGEDHVCLRGTRRFAQRVTARGRDTSAGVPAGLPSGAGLSPGAYLVAEAEPELADWIVGWLAERGARHIVLCGADENRLMVNSGVRARLAADGVELRAHRCVPADPDAVAGLVAELDADGIPVRGVVWAAVDWSLRTSTPADAATFRETVRARACGAWELHHRCPGLELFVVFTSASSAWGSIGSGVAGAADEPLAALVEWRRATGRPATCVQWAPWRLASLVDDDTITTMRRTGLRPLDPGVALAALEHLVAAGEAITSVVDVDEQLMLAFYRQALRWPLFTELGDADGEGAGSRLADQLVAVPPEWRHDLLVDTVLGEVAAVLGMAAGADLAEGDGLFELGMNSVGAIELRVRLQRLVGVDLPSTLAFDHPTAGALATYLAAALQLDQPLAAEPPEPAAADRPGVTDDELLARFESEMTAAHDAARQEW
ncbi:MAG: type I polyketide synthase [Pseudonocardiaceae bacterium]